MLSPNELKKKDFSRSMRGYSTQEVDEYVAFLIKKYTELYRANAELDRKNRELSALNDELSKDTRAVRAALLDAQRAAEKIVGDAKDEARMILASAKRSCDSILNEFHVLVEKERAKLVITKNAVSDFKARLYADYQAHIDRIEEITEDAEIPEIDEDELTERIITDIKTDAARWVKERSAPEPAPEAEDAPDPEIFDAANKAEEQDMMGQDAEEPAAAEPEEKGEEYPLDTEIIADPALDTASATRTFDPVADKLPEIEPEPEPEIEPEPEPEAEPEQEFEEDAGTDDYDDELAKLAKELSGEDSEE